MEVVEFVDPARGRGGGGGEYKRNRKLFMSSRAIDVLKDGGTSSGLKPAPLQDGNQEFFLRDFDLNSLFRGVERLVGDSHLIWKEKKKLEQERAEALGAKPVKKIRVPIDQAKLIQKKREREEVTKQEHELPRRKPSKRKKGKKR